MHDREIVAAIVAGEPVGLAAAYDRYAQALYAYCQALLTEPADAADAVQDTFIVASSKVSGLREPDRLRPWLYAVARNECHRRLRARASSAPLDEAAEATGAAQDPVTNAAQAELRALVRAALSGLNPGEREIIELNLSHEIDGNDLADTLGVPRNQAHALASRARSQFGTSLGVLLVARSGREHCPELAAMLDGWDGELTALIRKRVNRHIERCEVCGERRRRELSPAMLLGLVPVALLPVSLREQVGQLLADVTPGSVAYRGSVARRAEPFAHSGFPPQVNVPPSVRWRGHPGRTAGAAAAAAAVLGGALWLLPQHTRPPAVAGRPPGAPGAAGAGPHPSASGRASGPPAGQPGAGSSSPHSGIAAAAAHPAPTRPGVALPPAPLLPAPQPASPASQPSVSVSASAPVPGMLLVSPAQVQVGLTITLTAEGGPVTYRIAVPAALAVSSSSGSLKAGQSVTVAVRVAVGQALATNVTLTVDPGPIRIVVLPLPVAPLGL